MTNKIIRVLLLFSPSGMGRLVRFDRERGSELVHYSPRWVPKLRSLMEGWNVEEIDHVVIYQPKEAQ